MSKLDAQGRRLEGKYQPQIPFYRLQLRDLLPLRYLVVSREYECLFHKLVHGSLWHLQSYSNNPTVYPSVAITLIFFSLLWTSHMRFMWAERIVIIVASSANDLPQDPGWNTAYLWNSVLPGSEQELKQAGFSGTPLEEEVCNVHFCHDVTTCYSLTVRQQGQTTRALNGRFCNAADLEQTLNTHLEVGLELLFDPPLDPRVTANPTVLLHHYPPSGK